MGVVRMYRCVVVGVVVRRYIDILIIIITFPYSPFISSISTLFILKMFFCSVNIIIFNLYE